MNCYYHPAQQAVLKCKNCERPLCRACVDLYGGDPICANCAREGYQEIRQSLQKRLIIGAALGIAWIIFFLNAGTALSPLAIILEGIGFACVPFGWHALNSITPKMFLWLPLVGWLLYFFLKLCISIVVGWVAAPVQISKDTQVLRKIEAIERQREELEV